MKRFAFLIGLTFMSVACGGTTIDTTTSTVAHLATTLEAGDFPVSVSAANGEVEISARPGSIVSLSPSATENLFAIGAGDQVIAVDDQSNYPEDAPTTELSGFTPNLEAILELEPDLVVVTFDPGGLLEGLDAVGVPALRLPSASSLDDAYTEIEILGAATGHVGDAAAIVSEMQKDIDAVVAEMAPSLSGTTIYHELDPTFYSVSSSSYVGELYQMLGLVNIADEADPDGLGYPQMSSEYIVASDPDVILLADAGFGESLETLSQRPGWSDMTAVTNGAVIEVDPDLASRWTPRSVIFLQDVSDAIAARMAVG